MASTVMRDQKIFFDGYDLTGYINSLALEYAAESLDETVFGNDTRKFKGGLKTVAAGLQGFFETVPDNVLANAIGVSDKILSFGTSGNAGDAAYSFKAMAGSYKPSGAMGELFGYSLEAASTGKLVRGTILENRSAVQATGNGTVRQLGTVGANQRVYAALHVLASSGAGNQTLNVTLRSDNAGGFGSPTTQITFDQVGVNVGAQWKEIAGPITDDYWRPTFTIGGTGTPSFDFVIIQAIH